MIYLDLRLLPSRGQPDAAALEFRRISAQDGMEPGRRQLMRTAIDGDRQTLCRSPLLAEETQPAS